MLKDNFRPFNVIIFDLDGTLANQDHRVHHIEKKPKDWDTYYEECDKDKPVQHVIDMFHNLKDDYEIKIWTGRSDHVRRKTENWLEDKGISIGFNYWELRMREAGDHTPDYILKRKWYEEFVAAYLALNLKVNAIVFEDRARVVKMWRDLGVTCFQVADGNF